jgi:hypothetical protein
MKTPNWDHVNRLRKQVVATFGEAQAAAAAERALRVACDHAGTPVTDSAPEHMDTRALVDGALQQALRDEYLRMLKRH